MCLSSCVPAGQSGHQDPVSGLSATEPHYLGVKQQALVLGPGQFVSADYSLPVQVGESVDSAVQLVSTQGSPGSKSSSLAPRASSIQAQGFSDEVATRIEAP